MEAKSPTVLVSMPNAAAKPNTTRMAVNPAGTFLVSLGKNAMIAMESKVSPANTAKLSPASHAPPSSLNLSLIHI